MNVSYNRVEELPAEIDRLTALEKLYLENNRLKRLAPELGQLTSLTELDLSMNLLDEIPCYIQGLTKLKRISLATNQLRILPEFVQNRITKQNLCVSSITNNPWLTRGDLQPIEVNSLPTPDLNASAYKQLPRNLLIICAHYIHTHPKQFTKKDLNYLPEELGRTKEEMARLLRKTCMWQTNIIHFKKINTNIVPVYLEYQLCTPGDLKRMPTIWKNQKLYLLQLQSDEQNTETRHTTTSNKRARKKTD